MRYANQYASGTGLKLSGLKTALYGALLLGLLPIQAQAQAIEVCNSDVHIYGVEGAAQFFEGDELILNATIGAGMIRDNARPGSPDGDNPYIDFTGFGYGVDCGAGPMANLSDCKPVGYGDFPPEESGHDIEFLGVTNTDCMTAVPGVGAIFPVPESDNIVSIPVLNGVVRSFYKPKENKGETCNVDVKFKINELHASSNWVTQALGVPFDNRTAESSDDMKGVCSNDLSASGYGKTTFYVNTCEIDVDKQVSLDGETWVQAASAFDGDDVFYRIVLTNMGTAPLVGDVIVNDLILGVTDQPVDADGLKPGDSMIIGSDLIENFELKASCLTQTNTVNTAGVEAVCRVGTEDYVAVTDYMENTAELSCAPLPPSIDLVKTADPLIYSYDGETITYSFLVTNNGNVPLSNVYVSDPLPRLGDITCPDDQLDVSEAMTCTAPYQIDQADLNATVVDNTATAYGTAPDTSKVSDQSSAQIRTTPYYSLALVKTAAPSTYSAAGQVITYGYLLTNNGNQTLYPPYSVADNKTTVTCADQPDSLAPGAFITCAAAYTILEGDLPETATSVTNVAQGKAFNAAEGGSEVLSNEDDETVYYTGISVLKEIYDGEAWLDANTPGAAPVKHWPAGALYRITVKNIGVVDLVNVQITDAELGVIGLPVNGGSLPAGQEVVLTENEVGALNRLSVCDESGDFLNTVYGSGVAATSQQIVNAEDVAYLSCVGTPDIEVIKYISIDDGESWTSDTAGPVQAPSGALYKITVENIGDVDLFDVFVSDTLIPNDPFEVGELAVDEIVTITDGEWVDLNMATVCGVSGLVENTVDVIGTSVEFDEDTTDTDSAYLDCIDEPMISIVKKVSIDNGVTWHDANEEPFPTAVVDDNTPVTALYELTVENVGTVDLFNVLVNDVQLGITDYLVGSLIAGESAVLLEGSIPALRKENICSSTGKKTNSASAMGTSAAGESHEWFDSATVDCIGKPAIRILKEVSANGVTWSDTSITTLAPSDAYYRITVENIGNVALENVVVSDSILGISNYPVGSMAKGDIVVITHDDSGDLMLADLQVVGICQGAEEIPNTATADGKAVDSTETVHAEDEAMFICEVPVDICAEFGRPVVLKMQYEGVSVIDHHQGAAGIIVPHPVDLPEVATLELYDKNELEATVVKAAGEPFNILGNWTASGKIPPNITIKILDGATLKQTVTFHGSCSAPLVIGDQFGGVSIIGYTTF